jgi:hypothetical protein
MSIWDPNMDTLYSWAFDYSKPGSTSSSLEMDREKLIEIVDMVNSCISKEFEKDGHAFRVIKVRDPTAEERPDIHPLIREYNPLRK